MKLESARFLALAALLGVSYGMKVVTHRVVDGWPWRFPFGEAGNPPAGFTAACTASATFSARQHLLKDMMVPDADGGIESFAGAIKFFFGGRPFPGSWEGVDPEDVNRELLVVDWADVPAAVKEWIAYQQDDKDSPARWLFALYTKAAEGETVKGTARAKETPQPGESVVAGDQHKVLMFPPGSLYEILPLWVGANAESKECQAEFFDLRNYNATPSEGAVIAWPVEHTAPDLGSGSRDITFTIKAHYLEAIPGYEPPVPTPTAVAEDPVAAPAEEGQAKLWVEDESLESEAAAEADHVSEEPVSTSTKTIVVKPAEQSSTGVVERSASETEKPEEVKSHSQQDAKSDEPIILGEAEQDEAVKVNAEADAKDDGTRNRDEL